MVGTRPEAIKMAPLFSYFKQHGLPVKLCIVHQHTTLLDEMLELFEWAPDFTLFFDHKPTSLNDLFSQLLSTVDVFLRQHTIDWVFVQGDTATVCATALAAFNNNINIAHIEAGLRTHNLQAPFPEEAYRQIVSRITTIHYAPTEQAVQNLRAEGIAEHALALAGNTVVDALDEGLTKIKNQPTLVSNTIKNFCNTQTLLNRKIFVFTAHRRENHGKPLVEIFSTIKTFLEKNPKVACVYTTHPNPAVQDALHASGFISSNGAIAQSIADQVLLCNPLGRYDFLYALNASSFVVTDSGGVQEEAIALGKQIICVREVTERPEGVSMGLTTLVGSNKSLLAQALTHATTASRAMNLPHINPYGDGTACKKIFQHFISFSSKAPLPFHSLNIPSKRGYPHT